MHYQIILFDLDDTLVNFAASEAVGLQKLHEQFYSHIDYPIFIEKYRAINAPLWKRVGVEENALLPSEIRFLRFKYLNEQIECNTSAEKAADTYEYYLGEHVDWLPNVKEAIELLHRKGHILGIITNGLTEVQYKKKHKLNLQQWFDCFVVSDEIGISKPNKAIFERAIQEIASKRQQPVDAFAKDTMLMVGDSFHSDGQGAMNFGINYCHISQEPPAQSVTYHLNSVAVLPERLGILG